MLFADLHTHGPYSRATSKDISVQTMEEYARLKGISILGTGDFTHPKWYTHLKENLSEDGTGILKTKSGFPFILSTELSSIYSQDGKQRRIHQIVLAPSFEVVDNITEALSKHGRLDYDGRPIFGLKAYELVELIMNISPDCFVFPAHAWTPWFSLFGSNSGFDSLKECYQDQTKNIYALETGLSSNPPMNWRLSQLDKLAILSFSDLHSYWPWRIGREATVFNCKLEYKSIIDRIKKNEIAFTIEVDPAYGKYHFDGHRNCNVSLTPKEAIRLKNRCPVCRRQLTIGVLHRVELLADRPDGYQPENARPFKSLLPLHEIISTITGYEIASQKIWNEYNKLVKGTNEIQVLLEMNESELKKRTHERIADAIMRNRYGRVRVEPGYDGIYGKPLFEEKLTKEELGMQKQKKLSEF